MASWTRSQQKRLIFESKLLAKYFDEFQWYFPNDPAKTYVEGSMRGKTGKQYTVRVKIPSDYPNLLPVVYIKYPNPLRDHVGSDLSKLGMSSSMHLLAPSSGLPSICHYHPSLWTPNKTLSRVLIKALGWIVAYECHLKSGKPIDHYLRHQ